MKEMQCKDIPDGPILRFLGSIAPKWGNWFDGDAGTSESVANAMPQGVPAKLRLAKMRGLIKRGLVDGCACGCRGDFVLTDAGRALL